MTRLRTTTLLLAFILTVPLLAMPQASARDSDGDVKDGFDSIAAMRPDHGPHAKSRTNPLPAPCTATARCGSITNAAPTCTLEVSEWGDVTVTVDAAPGTSYEIFVERRIGTGIFTNVGAGEGSADVTHRNPSPFTSTDEDPNAYRYHLVLDDGTVIKCGIAEIGFVWCVQYAAHGDGYPAGNAPHQHDSAVIVLVNPALLEDNDFFVARWPGTYASGPDGWWPHQLTNPGQLRDSNIWLDVEYRYYVVADGVYNDCGRTTVGIVQFAPEHPHAR